MQLLLPLARYCVCNLSSPNTPGLRSLANPDFIEQLSQAAASDKHRIWIKLDPDMDRVTFQRLVESVTQCGFRGLILSNTHKVNWPESGGLSGSPLAVAAAKRLEWAYEVHRGAIPMIGVGGINSGYDAFERLARGASAIQIYTALVYRGPWAVALILLELMAEMRARGFNSVSDVIGSHYE